MRLLTTLQKNTKTQLSVSQAGLYDWPRLTVSLTIRGSQVLSLDML